MRIPSQFNEDSLYRRSNRRDDSAQNYRRLIRLVIGLALVIVIMRQASRPAIYQVFFPPQAGNGVPASTSLPSPASQSQTDVEGAGATTTGSGMPTEISPEDQGLADRLTQTLAPEDQRDWVVALSRWVRGEPVEPVNAAPLLEQLSSLQDLDEAQKLGWEVMLDSLAKSSADETGQTRPPSTVDLPRAVAFLSALDKAASSRVVDGSVWRSGDFDAFYRYLDQANDLAAGGVAATGVLPLLQQPDVFRDQLVRVHGGVARAQRMTADENPFGIAEYWQLWLRPSDGADRPLVAIVPAVPELVEAVGANAVEQEGPQVMIVGRFLKRLAYQSAIGADLAPVVVGRIVLAPVAQPSPAVELAQGRSDSRRMWITALLACLAGLAVAGLAMWRTSVMSKRTRHLRTAHRKTPDDFLHQLGNSTPGAASKFERSE